MEQSPSSRGAGAHVGRRSFMRGALCAAGSVATVPALGWIGGTAAASSWRGVIGCIKPRAGDSSLAELIRLMPDGIGIAVTYLNLAEGTREELASAYPTYEKNIAYLASQHCDVITLEGAPPFMILGPDGEAKMVDGWRQKYKVDMFTSSQNQVNVLRALKVKEILGFAPFGADLNKSYAKYFEDSGIGVVAMESINVAFDAIREVPAEAVYRMIKKRFLAQTGAEGIYILGSSLDALPVVAALEQDLGVPVVQATAARVWELQRRLHIRAPVKGYGILLETLPA
jgi:maleate cis-trans isomerase